MTMLWALLLVAPAFAADPAGGAADPALVEYVRRHAEPLDWRKLIGGARVVYLAENSFDRSGREELLERMDELAAAGVTHFAEELGDHLQPELDEFAAGKSDGEPVFAGMRRMISRWFHPELFVDLLKKAKDAGLGLLAPDMSWTEQARLFSELCDANPGCIRAIPRNLEHMGARDDRMVANLSWTLKDGKSRIVFLVGARHAQRRRQPEALERAGFGPVKSYLFLYDDGQPEPADDDAARANDPIGHPVDRVFRDYARAAREAKLGGRRFIPTDPARTGFDGIILLAGI